MTLLTMLQAWISVLEKPKKNYSFNKHLYYVDCKLFVVNLDIDLTQEMESQLQTGFIEVQVMAYVLLQWFRVT